MTPQHNAAAPVQRTWPHTITSVEALQCTVHLANFKDGSISKMPFDVRSLVRDALWSSCVRKTCACFCNPPCELENNKGQKEKKKQRKQRKANTSSEKKNLLFSLSNNFRKRTYAFFPLDSVKEKGEKMVQRADGANKHAVETTVSLVVTQKKVFIPDSQCIFPEIKCEK